MTDQVTLLVKLRLKDGTETEHRIQVPERLVQHLRQLLIEREEVREAWVYRQIAYHHKSYSDDFDDIQKLMSLR